MKINIVGTLLITVFLLASCRKADNKYLHKYPFFTNAEEFTKDKTVSLNNFTSRKNKNGLEYLLTNTGRLLEVRNWKNNYLNGNVFSYAYSGNLYLMANYINDTLCGNYYELDTITNKVSQYREKIKTANGVSDNQVLNFDYGKINYETSRFIKTEKLSDNSYKINLFTNTPEPYLRIYTLEKNADTYDFNIMDLGVMKESDNNKFCIYEVKDTSAKYLVGCIINYRYPTKEEIEEYHTDPKSSIGPVMYFKIKL